MFRVNCVTLRIRIRGHTLPVDDSLKVIAAARPGSYASGQVRRVVVLVLALITLGPAVAKASTWYRCAHDGVVRAACCCPPRTAHHATPDPGTRVRAACCCTITIIATRESAVRGAPPAAIQVTPAIPAIATIATPPPDATIRVAARELPRTQRGPPDPLFVRHCSLLL